MGTLFYENSMYIIHFNQHFQGVSIVYYTFISTKYGSFFKKVSVPLWFKDNL